MVYGVAAFCAWFVLCAILNSGFSLVLLQPQPFLIFVTVFSVFQHSMSYFKKGIGCMADI